TDTFLLGGQDMTAYFNLVELGEVAGFVGYASRLFSWGERAKVDNFLNLTFDGGFPFVGIAPLGWLADPVNGAGGQETSQAVWENAYAINGDGATAIRGMISQPACTDVVGNPILFPNVLYSVRVRLKRIGVITQGTFVIDVFSPTIGVLGTFSVSLPSAGLDPIAFKEFIGTLIINPINPMPTDAVLRVYVKDTLTLNASCVVENIEPFQTAQPFNGSIVRASKPEDPESYDGVTGFIQPDPNNGQEVRCCFKIRDYLYIAKERSLYITQDNGT